MSDDRKYDNRSVISAATAHFLLEYYLSSAAGISHIAAKRCAREISGATPEAEVLAKAATYFRNDRASRAPGA